jgi:ABC-type branched-subunit amino acid transport system permease subunit
MAGNLYAHLIRFLAPEASLFLSIEFLAMIVVGGWGRSAALLGTLVLITLQELLNRILRAREQPVHIVFGAADLTIMFLPYGLDGGRGRGCAGCAISARRPTRRGCGASFARGGVGTAQRR